MVRHYEVLAHLVVRARTADEITDLGVVFNRLEGSGTDTNLPLGFEHLVEIVPVVSDGTVQTYRVHA